MIGSMKCERENKKEKQIIAQFGRCWPVDRPGPKKKPSWGEQRGTKELKQKGLDAAEK